MLLRQLYNWAFLRDPISWRVAGILLVVFMLVSFLTCSAIVEGLTKTLGLGCGRYFWHWEFWKATFIAYLLVAWVGGTLAMLLFTEVNRKFLHAMGLTQRPRANILRPMFTGLIERTLFTTLAIILFNPSLPLSVATALVTTFGIYLGVKQFSREERTIRPEYVSLHAIWGSGVSLGLAALAGWVFWQVVARG
ncbi:MAG: hypothetical protein HY666_01975 [Chloroflexi bacterium]|nr:hypothetical protein [Chloroflexota bacterium]